MSIALFAPATRALSVSVLLLVAVLHAAHAQNPAPDPAMWETDGIVQCVARSGSTLYVGGQFEYVGPHTGGLAVIDAGPGTPSTGWPVIRGRVTAIAPDGAGGWFVGGSFTKVAGLARQNLAHLRADHSVDPWAPSVSGTVSVIAVGNGVVYVAGQLYQVGGQPRQYLAALDAASGTLLAWNPNPNGTVSALAVLAGTVVVGGGFTQIGGQARNYLATVDAATGSATSWNPNVAGGAVGVMVLAGSTLYVGGGFSSIGGLARSALAAIDPATGLVTSWNPGANAGVTAMAVRGAVVYVAGAFTTLAGRSRTGLAAIDAASGAATAWAPVPGPGTGFACLSPAVSALATDERYVYTGGTFKAIGGQTQYGVAALDPVTGVRANWNPCIGGSVMVLAVQGNALAAGGVFSSVGGKVRQGLAAFDLATGAATDWGPAVTYDYGCLPDIDVLAVHAGRVFIGGVFSSVGGQGVLNFAVVDSASGLTVSSRLRADGAVTALAFKGDTLFAGGAFTGFAFAGRTCVASFDLRADTVTSWNPRIVTNVTSTNPYGRSYFHSMVLTGDTLVLSVGGDSVGGKPARVPLGLVLLDARTAARLPWSMHVTWSTGVPVQMAVDRGRLYVMGALDVGMPTYHRYQLVQFDIGTGSPGTWDVGADAFGSQARPAFAIAGNVLYAGGNFGSLGGQSRFGLAGVRLDTAVATDWAPVSASLSTPFWTALAPSSDDVVVAGVLQNLAGGDVVSRYLVRFPSTSDVTPPAVHVIAASGGVAVLGGTLPLVWSASDDRGVESVDLWLSRTGSGGPWEPVALGLANSGSYGWTVSGPEASAAFLRVDARDAVGGVGSAISPAPFAIVSGATPTLVEQFRLEDTADGVAVRWRLANTMSAVALAPQRGPSAAGEWSALAGGQMTPDGAHTLLDRTVVVGGTYWYRLAGSSPDGRAVAVPAIAITHGGAAAFAVGRPSPNPLRNSATFAYSLPARASVRLSIVDVQGREVALLAQGDRPAGRCVSQFDAGDLAPGLYVLRLQSGREERRQRFVVIH